MQVLKMMDRGAKLDKGFYEYKNALKIYFNRDGVSITQVQADTACELLLQYYDSYIPDDPQNEKKFFDSFLYVLMYLGVRVIYDRANSTADFIGTDGSLVMSQLELKNVDGGRTVGLNPIKQTGTNSPQIFIYSGTAALFAVLGLVLLIIRRKGKFNSNGNHQ